MKDATTRTRSAARILVDQLLIQGIDAVVCVPGESFLAVLDALHDSPEIRLVTCRHEGAAAMMAEAHGKLTGRPGVVFCSRGPGTTNASHGLHVAAQDSTPFLMFIGQNARGVMEREGFQEVDYRRMFGSQAKAVWQIDEAARMSEFVTRGVRLAMSGRPGPVVMALPEDMLTDMAEARDGRRVEIPAHPPAQAVLDELRAALEAAERPMVLIGGGDWQAADVAAFQDFAVAGNLPVVASFRRQDKFDNALPVYAGELGLGANPTLVQRIKSADLVLALGARLGEICTQGYTLFDVPEPVQRLIHVYPDPDEFGHVYQPETAVVCRPGVFAAALAASGPLEGAEARGDWCAGARGDYEAWQAPRQSPGAIQMCEIMAWLDANLPEDTIYTNGAGNFSVWLHRFHRYRRPGTQLAPVSGSMGYGVPAAVAAALARPEATVVCFAGDGDFQMTGTEMATAAELGLRPRFLVLNNGMLGTIRMHQEREFPGRVSGTDLGTRPDFAAWAMACGGHGEKVRDTAGFAAAWARADAFDGPAVLEIMIDPEALSPATSLSALREKSLAAR